MSRAGDCWDNAVAESFFATLKGDLVSDADWHTRRDAIAARLEYIEVWYNRQRRHSSLGYRSPVQYELEYIEVWYNRQRRHSSLGYRSPVQYEREVLTRAEAA